MREKAHTSSAFWTETENRVLKVLGAQALDKSNCPKRCGCGINIFVASFSLFMFSCVPYFRVRPVLSRKITHYQVDHILTLKPIALCSCYVSVQQVCQFYAKKTVCTKIDFNILSKILIKIIVLRKLKG